MNKEVAQIIETVCQNKNVIIHYQSFVKIKKNGENRHILKPCGELLDIQRELSLIFSKVFQVHSSAHGFMKNRSVLTHAKLHLNANSLLNIDLKHFFTSIKTASISKIFNSGFPNISSSTQSNLIDLVCYEGCLPQGAPTSPILSNVYCYEMDAQLLEYAQNNGAKYSRYADDITFSFDHSLPDTLPAFVDLKSRKISQNIVGLFKSYGFELNHNKTRFQSKFQAMFVTGIKINEFPNVSRNYINNIRSMLYIWEKFGYHSCEKRFFQKYSTPRQRKFSTHPLFRNVIRGKLNYLKMIRGVDDPLYQKYAQWYNRLSQPFGEKKLKLEGAR